MQPFSQPRLRNMLIYKADSTPVGSSPAALGRSGPSTSTARSRRNSVGSRRTRKSAKPGRRKRFGKSARTLGGSSTCTGTSRNGRATFPLGATPRRRSSPRRARNRSPNRSPNRRLNGNRNRFGCNGLAKPCASVASDAAAVSNSALGRASPVGKPKSPRLTGTVSASFWRADAKRRPPPLLKRRPTPKSSKRTRQGLNATPSKRR